MICEKSGRYLYWIVRLYLSVVTFRYDILFPMQKQCYVVLRKITKSVEIQRAVTLVLLTDVIQYRQR
jgi:hypothetical protein